MERPVKRVKGLELCFGPVRIEACLGSVGRHAVLLPVESPDHEPPIGAVVGFHGPLGGDVTSRPSFERALTDLKSKTGT
jgi:hypothetical protein